MLTLLQIKYQVDSLLFLNKYITLSWPAFFSLRLIKVIAFGKGYSALDRFLLPARTSFFVTKEILFYMPFHQRAGNFLLLFTILVSSWEMDFRLLWIFVKIFTKISLLWKLARFFHSFLLEFIKQFIWCHHIFSKIFIHKFRVDGMDKFRFLWVCLFNIPEAYLMPYQATIMELLAKIVTSF